MTEQRRDLIPPEEGDRRLTVRQPGALSRQRTALGLLASAVGTVILRRAAELLAEDLYHRFSQRTSPSRARLGWRRRPTRSVDPAPAERLPVDPAAANAPRATPAQVIRRAAWSIRITRRRDGVETVEAATVEQIEVRHS